MNLALLAVAGAGLLYYSRVAAAGPLVNAQINRDPLIGGGAPGWRGGTTGTGATDSAFANPTRVGSGGNPFTIATSGATAAAGIATALGLASTTALMATGIGAVAALLAWGVLQEGWFRGGEEALVVNPARDAFVNEFAELDPYRDGANPPGFYGLAWLLEIFGQDSHFSPPNAAVQARGRELFASLLAADTKAGLEAAVDGIKAFLQPRRKEAAYYWDYARQHFPIE